MLASATSTVSTSTTQPLMAAAQTTLLQDRELSGGAGPAGPRSMPLSSTPRAFFNSAKSLVGVGILSLPYAFKLAGWLLGGLTIIGLACVCTATMTMLVRCKQRAAKDSGREAFAYADVGEFAGGKWGRWAVVGNLALSQIGFCAAYLLFIGKNLHYVFPSISPTLAIVVIAMPAVLPVTLLRHLSHLGVVSLLGMAALLAGIAAVFSYELPRIGATVAAAQWETFPMFFGITSFAYEGVAGLAIEVESSMARPRNYGRVLAASMALITTVNIAFGMVGYLVYGADAQEIVTANLPSSPVTSVLILCLCVEVWATYPGVLYPLAKLADAHWLGYQPQEEPAACSSLLRVDVHSEASPGTLEVHMTACVGPGEAGHHASTSPSEWLRERRCGASRRWWLGCAVRGALVGLSGALALCVPDFGSFISLMGAVTNSALIFTLPTLFYLRVFGSEIGLPTRLACVAVLILALVASVMSALASVRSMATHGASDQ